MKLDQFLKWQALVTTGGEAKQRIQRGDVRVNGVVETRRGRQLATGDAVSLDGREVIVMPASGGGERS
ncbi:MAG: RNA-binding S4 domain-containing protein [Synechococcus sp.]|nr:RNA-binding S4 domain-containing protein [Synechococcus sp.]